MSRKVGYHIIFLEAITWSKLCLFGSKIEIGWDIQPQWPGDTSTRSHTCLRSPLRTCMPTQAKTSLSDPVLSSSYVPLFQNDDDFNTVVESKLPILPSSQPKCNHHRVYALYIVIGVLLVFNILLLGVVISLRSTSHPNPQIIFCKWLSSFRANSLNIL